MAYRASLFTYSIFSTIFLFLLLSCVRSELNITTSIESSANFEIVHVSVKPDRPFTGENFTVKFALKNNASVDAVDINITVTTTPKLELISRNYQIHLNEWNAGGVIEVTYDFVAHAANDYIINVNIESDNLGSFKAGQLVEVYSRSIILLADWGWALVLGAIASLLVIGFIVWKRKAA